MLGRHAVTPVFLALILVSASRVVAQTATERPFVTNLSLEQMAGKQGVLETDLGTIIIDLLPESAPNHVGLFIERAEDGAYDGTTFHRMVARGSFKVVTR